MILPAARVSVFRLRPLLVSGLMAGLVAGMLAGCSSSSSSSGANTGTDTAPQHLAKVNGENGRWNWLDALPPIEGQAGETETTFMTRAGRTLSEHIRKDNKLACGVVCTTPGGQYSLTLITLHDEQVCPVMAVCADGATPAKVVLRSRRSGPMPKDPGPFAKGYQITPEKGVQLAWPDPNSAQWLATGRGLYRLGPEGLQPVWDFVNNQAVANFEALKAAAANHPAGVTNSSPTATASNSASSARTSGTTSTGDADGTDDTAQPGKP